MSKSIGNDFASLDIGAAHDRGFEVEVLHPQTGAPLGSFITLLGEESDKVQAFMRKQINAELRKKGDSANTIEALEATAIEKLVVATVSWRGVNWGNEELDCTPENARKIYANKRIREQLFKEMADDANFPMG